MTEIASSKELAEKKLVEVRKALQEKEAVFSTKTSESAVLQSRIKELEEIKTDLAKKEGERTSIQAEIDKLNASLDQLPPDIEALVQKLTTDGMTMEQAISRTAVVSAELEGLKKLDSEKESLDTRQKTLVARQKEVDDLIAFQRKILQNKDKILTLVEEEKSKTAEIVTLKAEQESLDKAIEQLNATLKKIAEMDTEAAKLRGTLAVKDTAKENAFKAAWLNLETLLRQEITRLENSLTVKEKERENALKAARLALESAQKESTLLDQTVCKAEGKFASCVLIEKALASKNSIPSLEAKVVGLTDSPEPEEKAKLELLLKDKAALSEEMFETAFAGAKTGTPQPQTIEMVKTIEAHLQTSLESVAAGLSEFAEPEEKAKLDLLLKERESFNLEVLEQELATSKDKLLKVKDSIKVLEQRLTTINTWTEKAPQINSADAEIKRLEAQNAEINKDVREYNEKMMALGVQKASASRLEKELKALQGMLARLKVEAASKDLKKQIEVAGTAITEYGKKLKNCVTMEKTLSTLQSELDFMKLEIVGMKETEKTAFSQVTGFEVEIKGCTQAEAEAKEKTIEVEGLSMKIKVFEFLEEAYAKVPFLIFDNIIELMEEDVNRVLSEISTNGMRVEFHTDKQNKNGGVKDAWDIIVSDVVGERKIELYSGGEKTRQILALAVGLAELNARKAGEKIETMFIDEPGGLDRQGLDDFGRCFIRLVESGMFKKGILVAHEPALLHIFEQKILVTRNGGSASHVEVIA